MIAISGGISAYKIADVISGLTKYNHIVKVITTEKALDFITPTVIGALSKNYITQSNVNEITHIDVAQSCDLFICAPATANIIAKFANGIADDFVSSVFLAIPKTVPKIIYPAMNTFMYENEATIDNIITLQRRGCTIMEPDTGMLACGYEGRGKFPSHNYKEGDKFNIEFEIAPRVIDAIKKKYPTSTLIGYKLFDGLENELINAGWTTLLESKANVIFCNTPDDAKIKKIALTPDGSVIPISFDNHIEMIQRLINAVWFTTKINDDKTPFMINNQERELLAVYPTVYRDPFLFGTFAIRSTKNPESFVTTVRGKTVKTAQCGLAYVSNVDEVNKIIYADCKATLNAPLLGRILHTYPNINYLVHGHKAIKKGQYEFPGTTGEWNHLYFGNKYTYPTICEDILPRVYFELPYHGYVAGFEKIEDCIKFCKEQ